MLTTVDGLARVLAATITAAGDELDPLPYVHLARPRPDDWRSGRVRSELLALAGKEVRGA